MKDLEGYSRLSAMPIFDRPYVTFSALIYKEPNTEPNKIRRPDVNSKPV